jgi:hypothetical protein
MPAMREENGRKYLFSLIPTDITYRTGCFIIIILGLTIFGIIKGRDASEILTTFFGFAAFIGIPTALQIYINKGYRASYDDEAIYLRPDGVNWRLQYKPENVMRYADIAELYADGGNMGLQPFEFIEIQRKGWDGEERFFLSRVYLRENQLKELLRFAYTKIPNKFTQDIIDYMNAEPGWIERKQMEADDDAI